MSQHTRVGSLESSIQKSNEWLSELSDLLETDRQTAYDALRGTLTTVRDLLAVEEAAQFAAEFPMLFRGMYFTGWDPSKKPERFSRQEFLDEVRRRAGLGPSEPEPGTAARAVFDLLHSRISAGEIADVIGQLPKAIQKLVLPESE